MISLKRKLKERFEVYNLDEYNTSKLNYKTEIECKNFSYMKNNQYRQLHSVLTYQMESKRQGCINRDYNSVNNMKKIVSYWLKYKERPEKFKRQKTTIKVTNPKDLSSLASSSNKPAKVQLPRKRQSIKSKNKQIIV